MRMMSRLWLLVLPGLLAGCMNAAVTGAQAVYNRHSLQKGFKDQATTFSAYRALERDTTSFKDANLSVTTFNGEVLLAGEVPVEWQKDEAERVIRSLPDVTQVYNLVQVASPASSLSQMSDVWLTAKVKAKLIACNDIDVTQLKVTTENSVVYLMGILPPEQAEAAVNIASNTAGVTKVVKMFSYIKITKTA